MSNREEIITVFSELNPHGDKFKRTKSLLKDKEVPWGKVDSVKDADDMADLLMGHFTLETRKKVILDIIKKTGSEDLIEKHRDILSDPSQRKIPNIVNGGTTSLKEITRALEFMADQYLEQSLSTERPALGIILTTYSLLKRRFDNNKEEHDHIADSSTANGVATSSLTEMNATTGRSITTAPESMANTHQEPQQVITANGAATSSSSTEMNATTGSTSSITTAPESMANTHQEPQQVITVNGEATSSSTEMNATTGRSITTAPESMANTHQEPQQVITVNGAATSSPTEINATSNCSNTTAPESTANLSSEQQLRAQQQTAINGGTTSSTTGSSATSSNTWVPVSAADKHPKRLCRKCKIKEVSATYIGSSDTGFSLLYTPVCKECEIKERDELLLLCKKLSNKITHSETEDMKTILIGREINKPKANDTAFDIFLDLEKRGYISPTDQTLLIELLEGIKRPDLVSLVKKYQDSV